jgi:hypothetical protein
MDTVALLFKHIHKIMADGNVEMLDEEGRIPGMYKNIAVDEWLVVDCRAHPSAPKKFDQNIGVFDGLQILPMLHGPV